MSNKYLFVIVGASGSGKGVLLRAVRDMGENLIMVIPKSTNRMRKPTDGAEIINVKEKIINRHMYSIIYGNYTHEYGIPVKTIWSALYSGKHALLICSNFASIDNNGLKIKGLDDAIPRLKEIFGPLMKLVYLYSPISKKDSKKHHEYINTQDSIEARIRGDKIKIVHGYYINNISKFDNVLLNIMEPEDLSDQLFRLLQNAG